MRYLASANAALADPEALAEWRDQFSDSCSVCLEGYQRAAAIHERGQQIDGGRFLEATLSVEESTSTQATFLVTGRLEGASVKTSAGVVTETYAELPRITLVYTTREQPDGSWLIVGGEVLG